MKPIICFWDGSVMVPLLRFARAAAQQFTVGQQYRMVPQHDRSVASHNHYFAMIETQWRKLLWGPLSSKFPTSEHLRHHALIRAGYFHQVWKSFSTRKDAERCEALLKGVVKFQEIIVEEARVTVLTAQSQSRAVMGERDFQQSKMDTLEYIETLVKHDGVEWKYEFENEGPARGDPA